MTVGLEKRSLVRTLVEEASDVDFICYLARSGGEAALKDLLECIRDAECLSTNDIAYNIKIVRKKKIEAHQCPMRFVFQRLMRPDVVPNVANEMNEEALRPASRLH